RIARPQTGQREPGRTTDSPRGRRWITTFRNDPTSAPSTPAKAAKSGTSTALARLAEVAPLEGEHGDPEREHRVAEPVGGRQQQVAGRERKPVDGGGREVEGLEVGQRAVQELGDARYGGGIGLLAERAQVTGQVPDQPQAGREERRQH